MKRPLLWIVSLWLTWLSASAQPLCRITRYDEADGVSSSHLTQLLQDEQGFMWFATWNGLCRYDGYEFHTFKPAVGDGCQMTTDRIRNITLLPGRLILCQVDEQNFMFDLRTYRFRDLSGQEQQQAEQMAAKYRQSQSLMKRDYCWTDAHQTRWTLHTDGRLSHQQAGSATPTDYPLTIPFHTQTFAVADRQGNLWALDYGSIYKLCTGIQRTKRLEMTPHAEVKSLFADRQGRYWVATRDDGALRVYNVSDDRLLGFMGADGRLHANYTPFGAAVYCMMQTADGTLWVGTKPHGLYRLRETAPHVFEVTHLQQLPHPDVYHIIEDRYHRLWVATLGGGVYYTDQPQAEQPCFVMPKQYPKERCPRARFLCVTDDDVLLVATSNGLLAAPLKQHADDMSFTLHQREPDRAESLSCSATMDVISDSRGRVFVSTESGGINQIIGSDLLAPRLSFRHLSDQFHVQPNDVVLSLTLMANGTLMAVGSHQITLVDSTLQGRIIDTRAFRFSEAHPLPLSNNRWLMGLTDGAFVISEEQMTRQAYTPPLVLTRATVQGCSSDWGIEQSDTLTLLPNQRSVTIHFAALDYEASDRISYAFRLQPDKPWNYIGHDRSATLLDLDPGTYHLEIRSTNADGEWQANNRQLTILVKPTFWESAWGRLLMALIVIATIAAIAYTIYYIRRIKRQQHETLEKYLALLDAGETTGQPRNVMPHRQEESSPNEADDTILKRVMAYVEQNIGNSEVSVSDLAAAAATSRSSLQRKLKQTMGITPQDLLREARIKHACQLLRRTDKTVAEVAYACGFTDPKYFSRCFRQRVGQSPTEYKNASN